MSSLKNLRNEPPFKNRHQNKNKNPQIFVIALASIFGDRRFPLDRHFKFFSISSLPYFFIERSLRVFWSLGSPEKEKPLFGPRFSRSGSLGHPRYFSKPLLKRPLEDLAFSTRNSTFPQVRTSNGHQTLQIFPYGPNKPLKINIWVNSRFLLTLRFWALIFPKILKLIILIFTRFINRILTSRKIQRKKLNLERINIWIQPLTSKINNYRNSLKPSKKISRIKNRPNLDKNPQTAEQPHSISPKETKISKKRKKKKANSKTQYDHFTKIINYIIILLLIIKRWQIFLNLYNWSYCKQKNKRTRKKEKKEVVLKVAFFFFPLFAYFGFFRWYWVRLFEDFYSNFVFFWFLKFFWNVSRSSDNTQQFLEKVIFNLYYLILLYSGL